MADENETRFAGFDVIGDVHAHAEKLVGLLDTLGYESIDGTWRHATRQAIFVGDLVDRGPEQVRCVEIVRAAPLLRAQNEAVVGQVPGDHANVCLFQA